MIRALLIVVVTAGTFVMGFAAAEDAPQTLIDASPGAGTVVVRTPEEVSLSFRAAVSAVHVRVFEDDDMVSESDSVVEGTLAIAQVELDGPGSYLVDWKGTDGAGAPIAGAYVFLVDPRGDSSIAVDREVAGASGALGGLRVVAASMAALGAVALLVGVVGWIGRAASESSVRIVGSAALATGLGGLVAAGTYGVPSDGSLLDLADPKTVSSAVASGPGRVWLTAACLMGVMPLVLVLRRSISARWVAGSAIVAGAVGALWVAVGLGWLTRLPWPLMCIGLATAAALWLSINTGRPIAVAVSLGIALAVAVPIVTDVRGSGVSSAVQAGDLLIEASLDPARSGINELHLYGSDVSGRGAPLGPTSVAAYHRGVAVGPLDLPVLRAGPNHLLSYHAVLPLSGDWTLRATVATAEGEDEVVVWEMEVR